MISDLSADGINEGVRSLDLTSESIVNAGSEVVTGVDETDFKVTSPLSSVKTIATIIKETKRVEKIDVSFNVRREFGCKLMLGIFIDTIENLD